MSTLILRPDDAIALNRTLSMRQLKKSELYRSLHRFSLEMIFYFLARSKHNLPRQRIELYLSSFLKAEPMVRGRDLKKWNIPPGPRYREILDRLFDLQLDGEIQTMEEAKKFAVKFSKEKPRKKAEL